MEFGEISVLPVGASLLGESPFWQAESGGWLWWCDIPGKVLHAAQPATMAHAWWQFDTEPCSCAPLPDGNLILALRDGLFRFNPSTQKLDQLAPPPYDPRSERFNDGKCDPQGRFWVGTIYEPRDPPLAALYRHAGFGLKKMADGITVSNGLAFSPDGRTMYWSDTKAHTVYAFDFEPIGGSISRQRVFASFAPRAEGQALEAYGGRPDGAAVDVEGCYWVAMFEGARVLRIDPQGQTVAELKLPVRCPTMPCFGGSDLRTLYITTSREKRPAEELAREPWAGSVLQVRVPVAGLPVNMARA
ncbi:MAG: SMP-30/gluconolactonase/LRE family protein [Rubrivivax sp.]|nr:SMP-30/gluconolactonase/LRE family protein [Rubrivivax sp.]